MSLPAIPTGSSTTCAPAAVSRIGSAAQAWGCAAADARPRSARTRGPGHALCDEDFRIIPGFDTDPLNGSKPVGTGASATSRRSRWCTATGRCTALPELLVSFSERLQGGFLVGGIASAQNLPVQVADRAEGGGLSGVLFSGKVAISTGLSQGCSLIGQRHRITPVSEISSRLSTGVRRWTCSKRISARPARDLRRVGGYIFVALPIAGSDTADYLVRNLIGIDPDRGLIAIGDMPQPGMEVQFARRDAETAREDLAQMIDGLMKRLPGEPAVPCIIPAWDAAATCSATTRPKCGWCRN